MLVFDAEHLAAVGAELGKRHCDQDRMLALTQANHRALVADPQRFAPLGVQVLELGDRVTAEPVRDEVGGTGEPSDVSVAGGPGRWTAT